MDRYADPNEQLVVEVSVRDLERSKTFYQQLGFAVALEKPGFLILSWDGHELFLDERRDLPPAPSGALPNVRILVPDVDAHWRRAQAVGARVLSPIADRDYGLRDFTIADPDGFGLRFATRLDAATDVEATTAFLESTPGRIARLVQGLSAAELRRHPTGTGWSVGGHHFEWSMAQHVCHLRDLEREGYGIRIERFTREATPFFPDVDGDRLAAERDYDGADATTVAADFAAARAASLHAARATLSSGRETRGELEGAGSITLVDLLGFMRGHDAGHLEAMERLHEHWRSRPPV